MADRLITDEELARRYRDAQSALPVPGAHPDEALWVALATDEADADTRTMALDHILRCPDCTQVWQGMSGLTHDAEAEGLLHPPAHARMAWLSSPAVRFGVAATLVMAVAVSAWMGGRSFGTQSPDVVRSSSGTATALAVEAVLDMELEVEVVARRAVTLLTCPAPTLGGGERVQASLAGPSAQEVWTAHDVDPVSGRVRVVVDLTDVEAGTWTLRLLRMDASSREQSTTACAFELR